MNKGFYQGPVYKVVEKMKASGNQPGVIRHWKSMVAHWAEHTNSPDAEAVKAMLPLWQERPFYTSAELAPMMPALAVALGVQSFSGRMPAVMSPKLLAHCLAVSRLPFLMVDGTQYFIVEQTHRAEDMRPMIEEFHHAHNG